MKLKLTILIVFLSTMGLFAQNILYVNATKGNDENDGTSWSKAFETIQAALDKVKANEEIWVAAGTYLPTKKIAEMTTDNQPTSERTKSFVIPKGVKLYGGFPAGATDATKMAQRNWEANPTILSGDFNDDDNDFENMGENAYHVVVLVNPNELTLIDGFTITGGNANGNEAVFINQMQITSHSGGGIYASFHSSVAEEDADLKATSPTLKNVIIENNKAIACGGGFYNFACVGKASPTISHSIIRNNKAGYSEKNEIGSGCGGGIYNEGVTYASPVLTNVVISGNDAERLGGGFYCMAEKETDPILTNVLISGNTAHDAAGMYCFTYVTTTIPILTNVTIVGNKAVEDGAGLASISYAGMSAPIIYNSVLWGNKCTANTTKQNPNLFNSADTGTPEIHNSFIEGETASAATGNIDGTLNPEFASAVDASFAPTTDGDYQLTKPSPLINKGTNGFITETEDLAGKTRIIDGKIDIGAYEYPEVGGGTSNDEILTEENSPIWADAGNLYIKTEKPTTIRIYTVDGTLYRQINKASEGTKVISLPSGIYFISLNNDEVKAKIFVPLQ